MKKSKIFTLLLLCLISCLSSCNDDDDTSPAPSDMLTANLGDDRAVDVGQEVAITFSRSTLPDGFGSFTLRYSGGPGNIMTPDDQIFAPGNVVFTTSDIEDKFIFTPLVTGTHVFLLEVTSGNTFSNDEMIIEVGGIIELTNATLSSISELIDVNPGFSLEKPDYVVNEVLEISNTLNIAQNVVIKFGAGGGIVVNGGVNISTTNAAFIGDGWKGFLLKSGSMDLVNTTVSGAGATAYEGLENAAITVESGGIAISNSEFENTTGTNINILEDGYVSTSILSTRLDAADAIRCDFFDISKIRNNTFLSEDSYVTVLGAGDTFLSGGSGSFLVDAGPTNYYFKGGVTFGQFVTIKIESEKSIFFEENTGAAFSAGVDISGTNSVLKGWDDADWKGIYVGTSSSKIEGITLEKAGSSKHTLSTSESAAIYSTTQITNMTNVTIKDSRSFGVYFSNLSTVSPSNTFDELSFSGNAKAPIVIPIDFAKTVLEGNIEFDVPEGIEAVRLLDQKANNNDITLKDLGEDHFYIVAENINIGFGSTNISLTEGVHMKFSPGTALYLGISTTGGFSAIGTEDNPIVLEPLNEVEGWDGIFLGSTSSVSYTFNYVNVYGGGASTMSSATDKANIVMKDDAPTYSFKNCIINDSKGWGVLIESFATTYDFEDPLNNNSFSGNMLGNVLDKSF